MLQKVFTSIQKDQCDVFRNIYTTRKSWKYSSPNRTLLSIESGFVPLNFGSFNDHDINEISFELNNMDDLVSLFQQEISDLFEDLDKKIKKI